MRFFRRFRLSLIRARLLFSISGFIVWELKKRVFNFNSQWYFEDISENIQGDAEKFCRFPYLSELKSLFPFGKCRLWRVGRESFTNHVWRHFQHRLCATEVLKASKGEDVSLTVRNCAIYPVTWRRFPCVTGTPPSQHKTIWTNPVLDESNTKASYLLKITICLYL